MDELLAPYQSWRSRYGGDRKTIVLKTVTAYDDAAAFSRMAHDNDDSTPNHVVPV